MGSESTAYEAEGQMGYWLRGHEGKTNNIVLVFSSWSKVSRQNNFSQQNTIQPPLFWFSKLALFATSGL